MPTARLMSLAAPYNDCMSPRRPFDPAFVDAALADGATVVTPNRRLARDLKRRFDAGRQRQAARGTGPAVWPAADVLPWSAWLVRSQEETIGAHPDPDTPMLLNALQRQVLWEQAVAASGIAPSTRAAELLAASADDAWALLHQHGEASALARHGALSDDQRAFAQWCDGYARRLRQRRAMDDAQLPRWLAGQVREGRWMPAQRVVLAGFDRLRPMQQQLIDVLRERGASVDSRSLAGTAGATEVAGRAGESGEAAAVALRVACADPPAQWRAAAAWARQRLQENPAARIGIVVPDLQAQRHALSDTLGEALAPAQRLSAVVDPTARPFNVSLGSPLAGHPLAATAQALLDLVAGEVPIAAVGLLLRSPYLAAGACGEAEWSARARLDASLRRAGHWQLSLIGLRAAAARAPTLAQALLRIERRMAATGARSRPLSAWVALMFDLLRDAGFPGSRPLDSAEYQAHQAWREALAALASLDEYLGAVTLPQALARARRQLADTLFQPESADAPVQVLGVLESSNLRFDHLWVANLSDDRWPPAPQPNPLLPLVLQRAWGEPTACAENALALARVHMSGWLASAPEVVFSHPLHDGDDVLAPSPLITALPATTPEALAAPIPALALALKRGLPLDPVVDETGPTAPPPSGAQAGGARLLEDQSACPFRAFAVHRLHARALDTPEPGFDALSRGSLLHGVLHRFWHGLDSQQALLALDSAQRTGRLHTAAEAAVDDLARERPGLIGPRMRAIESARLMRLCLAWLDIEAARPPFRVVDLEAQDVASVGGLTLRLQPDRVDRVEGGALVVIDYKTGKVSAADWQGERPHAPQLPLYATMLAARSERVHAIAFAQIRAEKTCAVALGDDPPVFDGARSVEPWMTTTGQPAWAALLDDWRARLERLAAGYLAGAAAVAPARAQDCRHCDLPALCRLQERRGAAEWLADDASDGDSDD